MRHLAPAPVTVLPANGDDNLGAGTFFFRSTMHWGAGLRGSWQTLRIPGRPFGNQVVLNTFFQEYPPSYYFEVIE